MGNSASSVNNGSSVVATAATTTTQEQQAQRKTPNCKICCACPQERRARDECTLLRHMDECETEINSFYTCLLREGFSTEDVDALRRNTKKM
ncbi:cytochrome c oxidase copper chaperone [Novymonas esmeraldas]|uniref:Cytochrome c oxidase copper chaperone n=1 Tax=Novymonas esmeraldas TaxID=1808958 RepID=A0AAW0ETK2_9TRYP